MYTYISIVAYDCCWCGCLELSTTMRANLYAASHNPPHTVAAGLFASCTLWSCEAWLACEFCMPNDATFTHITS